MNETALKCDICDKFTIIDGKTFFHVFKRIKGKQKGATAKRWCQDCFQNKK